MDIKKASHFCKAFIIKAPLFLERCNYNAMIEYITIRKINV